MKKIIILEDEDELENMDVIEYGRASLVIQKDRKNYKILKNRFSDSTEMTQFQLLQEISENYLK
jgi:hypothetical protein